VNKHGEDDREMSRGQEELERKVKLRKQYDLPPISRLDRFYIICLLVLCQLTVPFVCNHQQGQYSADGIILIHLSACFKIEHGIQKGF